MTSNDPYYLGFSHMFGIGPMRFKKLVAHFGNVKKAYHAKEAELVPLLGSLTAGKFVAFRDTFDSEKTLQDMSKKGIQLLTLESPHYPKQLANISDPPIALYVVGNSRILNQESSLYFAIVGTRMATDYGRAVARKFAEELTDYGFTIVSGMALGIDGVAHQACLDRNGKTIAVLGCGVDIIYPPYHRKLYNDIVLKGGAIVSEFPPGLTVLPGFFVARNRIISGLSSGVLIVEGAKASGALITARYAAEQGRDVYAPPSPITSQLSQAPNILLKQGAKMVTTVEDILEEYEINIKPKDKSDLLKNLDEKSRKIVEILLREPQSADELARQLMVSIDEILNTLTLLEIEGILTKNQAGKYSPR